MLSRAGDVETLQTERQGHATELAARAADAVVVFGGDGVVNEVLNGLPEGVPLGALPGGGTNVFARALGLPRDPLGAAARIVDAIVSGRTRRIGLGRVHGRRFAFAAGVGFDADIVRRIDALGRAADGRRPGDLAFASEARACACRLAVQARARPRGRGSRARGFRHRRQLRSLHVCGTAAAARRAGGALRARPRRRRAGSRHGAFTSAARDVPRARQGRAARPASRARRRQDRDRLRPAAAAARRTARIWATSSTSCSRPSVMRSAS